MKNNKMKSDFLGMPFGTASHRLRKSILFKYVQMAGHDVCYRCGLKIESELDFSIDHKEPWEGISVERFWDLDNIAFSHLKCNFVAKRNPPTAVDHGTYTMYASHFCRCDKCKRANAETRRRQRNKSLG